MLPGAADTIVALATAPGRGATALVRVSGPRAVQVVSACVGEQAVGVELPQLSPRRPSLRRLVHPRTGDALDSALVTWFPAPHSYTGDDVVEISTHGGLVVPTAVVAALLSAGAREALPGEFTRRAVMAGKMDLLQAEAVGDLIDARSSAWHRVALAQLDGGLSQRLMELRTDCVQLEALLAYDIDFPEEDDGPIEPARVQRAVDTVIEALEQLLATAPAVPMVREGAIVVLAGAPNAGKSSLFNALLGEARAIVSEIPGTTRDALDVLLDTPGVPLRLVDTAGLRDSSDVLEQLGIEVSARWLARAHVVVVCGEDGEQLEAATSAVLHARGGDVPLVRVLTKQDGAVVRAIGTEQSPVRRSEDGSEGSSEGSSEDGTERSDEHGAECSNAGSAVVATSAESGIGLSELLLSVQQEIVNTYGSVSPEQPRLTRERHLVAVQSAHDELVAFRAAWDGGGGMPAIIAAVHVRAAVHALDELIGVVSLDDVLDRLFAEFCVGK